MNLLRLVPCALLLCALPLPASASDGPPDLVAAVTADPRFATLRTALVKADLVDTLHGAGPFTVFAPTNEAFDALPSGALARLLEPAQKDALRAVLLNHVVAGAVRASALLPVPAAKTVGGASLPLGLQVGGARVVQADISCSNGVIHVIDRVLFPTLPAEREVAAAPTKAPAQETPMDVVATLLEAINERGGPLYNKGDHEGCARVYEATARRLHAAGRALSDLDRADLEAVLANLKHDPDERAWQLRRAFDRILDNAQFEPRSEASLPAGFPAPGPVGRVMVKRYPSYRAARADGGGAAFWTLFQHIKKNKVEMTAPVEMTMDEGMRERDMAFLYETTEQGSAGQDGSVRVLDLKPIEVMSIGMRGSRGEDDLARAKAAVERRMQEDGLEAAGAWRVLGYNSPMVPVSQRYWELQIPIRR